MKKMVAILCVVGMSMIGAQALAADGTQAKKQLKTQTATKTMVKAKKRTQTVVRPETPTGTASRKQTRVSF